MPVYPLRFNPPTRWPMPSDRWVQRNYGITPAPDWRPRLDYPQAPRDWAWWVATEPDWYAAIHIRAGVTWITFAVAITCAVSGVVASILLQGAGHENVWLIAARSIMIAGVVIALLAAIHLVRLPKILIREDRDAATKRSDQRDADRYRSLWPS